MASRSIIIVTYNSAEVIRECLAALSSGDDEILVIDNNSSDDTCMQVREAFPDVRLVENSDNLGYGVANNQGVELASGDLIAIINPDLITSPEALNTLFAYLESHPEVGVVGPRATNGNGVQIDTARPEYTAARVLARYFGLERFSRKLIYSDYASHVWPLRTPVSVAWLQGSCLVMRRRDFLEIGGFDPAFFLFAEDADLCERFRRAGQMVIFHGGVEVTHYLSTSTRKAGYISIRSYHISPLIYFRKRGKHGAVWLLKLGFTLELLIKILKRGLRGAAEDRRNHSRTLRDVWRF